MKTFSNKFFTAIMILVSVSVMACCTPDPPTTCPCIEEETFKSMKSGEWNSAVDAGIVHLDGKYIEIMKTDSGVYHYKIPTPLTGDIKRDSSYYNGTLTDNETATMYSLICSKRDDYTNKETCELVDSTKAIFIKKRDSLLLDYLSKWVSIPGNKSGDNAPDTGQSEGQASSKSISIYNPTIRDGAIVFDGKNVGFEFDSIKWNDKLYSSDADGTFTATDFKKNDVLIFINSKTGQTKRYDKNNIFRID